VDSNSNRSQTYGETAGSSVRRRRTSGLEALSITRTYTVIGLSELGLFNVDEEKQRNTVWERNR